MNGIRPTPILSWVYDVRVIHASEQQVLYLQYEEYVIAFSDDLAVDFNGWKHPTRHLFLVPALLFSIAEHGDLFDLVRHLYRGKRVSWPTNASVTCSPAFPLAIARFSGSRGTMHDDPERESPLFWSHRCQTASCVSAHW